MVQSTLELIKDIGEIIATGSRPKVILNKIVQKIAQDLQVEVCSIFIYSQHEQKLVLAATEGMPQAHVDTTVIASGEGITGTAFSRGQLLNIVNPTEHPDNLFIEGVDEESLGCLLSVPIFVGGRSVGVMNLRSGKKEPFSDEIITMVQTLTPQVGNILLDQKMFSKIRRVNPRKHKKREMQVLKGQAVSIGLDAGKALIMDTDSLLNSIYWQPVEDVDAELNLLDKALEHARAETIRLEKEASKILTESDASIFYSHLLLLEDKQLIDTVRGIIEEGTIVKFALKTTLLRLKKEFAQIEHESFRERLADITDVILRLVHSVNYVIQGKSTKKKFFSKDGTDKIVIIAHELYPSQLITWPISKMAGIICETGGATSHVAILSKALRIPTLMGVKHATKQIKQNEDILLDCHSGRCYVHPTAEILKNFAPSLLEHTEKTVRDLTPVDSEQTTLDGQKVDLLANISLVSELPMLPKFGAGGVGLYRTEFLYMIRTSQPTVDDQLKIYTQIAEGIKGKPMTLRLLDVGGDKPIPYLEFEDEQNPLLGVRGIRMLLRKPSILRPHIEAILLASEVTRINILIPMISTIEEVIEVKRIISNIAAKLEKKHERPFNNYDIGVMIETPSIVWELEKIIKHVDFASIGSNDLVQYIFAIDRNNEYAGNSFTSISPATFKNLKYICDIVNKAGKRLSICGEMASVNEAIPLLIGAGLRAFSMGPWQIPKIREFVQKLDSGQCQKLVEDFIASETQQDANDTLATFMTQHGLEKD